MKYDIYTTLNEYYIDDSSPTYEFHRFHSWQHCYEYFKEERNKGYFEDKEKASLHLGFYLASWGMYRGSTFLLQNNSKIHLGVIDIIEQYFDKDFDNFDNIQSFQHAVKEHYKNALPNSKESNNVTRTLITKILLGVFACIPAYDRYFIQGLINVNPEFKVDAKFDSNSFTQLNNFYEENIDDFNKFNANKDYVYPKMKLLDAYFWMIGTKPQVQEKN